MHKKIILMCFILIVVVIFNTFSISAQTFINIYVDETGNALFLGETDKEIELPDGVEISNGEIIGKTQELTSKQGEFWTFEYSLENAEMNVILPKGAVIKELVEGEIGIEDNQISIYIKDNVSVSYIIEEQKKSFNWIVLISIILIFALVILYSSFKLKKNRDIEKKTKKIKKLDRLEIVKDVLNEREKIIIEKLKDKKQIKSSILRKLCDIPKASFSRHVQELEKKGLIKRTGEGKNKIISLK